MAPTISRQAGGVRKRRRSSWALLAATWLTIGVQVGLLRPRLDRRTATIVAGRTPPHHGTTSPTSPWKQSKVPVLIALGTALISLALPRSRPATTRRRQIEANAA
jgi:hypothetical protein